LADQNFRVKRGLEVGIGATVLVAQSSGNIGVGNTNPSTQLHISSSSPIIRLQDTDTTNRYSDIYQSGGALYFDARDGSSNGSIIFRGVNPSSTEYARITSTGNVGIGTDSPVRPLHITSSDCRIRLEQTGETIDVELQNVNGNAILTTNGESDIRLQTDNAERMRILSTGEVGINSTSPTEKLDVIGTVKATDFNTTSDQNLKTNIQTIEDPLEKIVQIRGVNFEWKENNKPSAGVIAQEVEKVLPQLVNGEDTKTVNYNGLIGLLVEAVKAQQEEINELKRRIG